MAEEKEKTANQILKENTLEKAKDVAIQAIEKGWDDIWKGMRRLKSEGHDCMSLSNKLEITKVTDDKCTIAMQPSWSETHKTEKVTGEVSTTPELDLEDQ